MTVQDVRFVDQVDITVLFLRKCPLDLIFLMANIINDLDLLNTVDVAIGHRGALIKHGLIHFAVLNAATLA